MARHFDGVRRFAVTSAGSPFPPQCLRCDAPQPGWYPYHANREATPGGLGALLIGVLTGFGVFTFRSYELSVPLCPEHAAGLRRADRAQALTVAVGLILGLGIALGGVLPRVVKDLNAVSFLAVIGTILGVPLAAKALAARSFRRSGYLIRVLPQEGAVEVHDPPRGPYDLV